MNEVTRILSGVDQGDSRTIDELLPLVYEELRRLAAHRLAQEKPGQTLQATALVNEAYLRLVSPSGGQSWDGRGHFFAAAAEAMRRILVENARRKGREKRGGGRRREQADLDNIQACEFSDDILALNEALEDLKLHDPLKAKLVMLRYFGGLTLRQAATCLDISPSTADRAWRYSRAWLYAAMANSDPEEN